MKLFSVATLAGIAIAQEDQWDTSFQGKFKLDKDEDAYKTFQSMLARAENDGSDQVIGIDSRTKVGTSNDSISKMQLRKYETMKKMILYLHDSQDREWGRYCPYGCHCMVNGPNDILSGHGNPVDEIDSACKRHQECIACAMNDFGADVCPWWKPYKMNAMIDTDTGDKYLVCEDAPGYCKRSLCECDAQLARDIYEQRKTYDRDFHHRYGTFNKDQCRSVNRGKYEEVSGNKKEKGTGAGKGLGPQCCGEFPRRFSYKPGKQECCANNQIASIGSC